MKRCNNVQPLGPASYGQYGWEVHTPQPLVHEDAAECHILRNIVVVVLIVILFVILG